MAQSDFHAPVVPPPSAGLGRLAEAQMAPQQDPRQMAPSGLPPEMAQQLGAPGGMSPMGGGGMSMMPPQGGMGPQGGMYDPSMGGGQPPPQMGQPSTSPSGDMTQMVGGPPQQGGDEGDELDQYVNWQAQQLMARQGDPQADQHLGFLQTLKGAKDRDPEGFYMILSALATGDPHNVMQVAQHLRGQRQATQAATQQQLMGVARERGQRRQAVADRQVDREDRQTFAKEQRESTAFNTYVNRLSDKGLLDRVQKKMGRPIQSFQDMADAREAEARLNASDKVVKQAGDYVGALSKGPQPMAGLIKAHYEADPNFRQVVDEANSRRGEMDDLKKENLKARTQRAKQVAAVTAKVDPAMKVFINDLQRRLTEAENDEDSAQREYDTNTMMSKMDVDDTLGARSLSSDLASRMDSSRSKADSLRDQLNDALATIGAPTSGGRRRPDPLDDGDDPDATYPPAEEAPRPAKKFGRTRALLGLKD